MSVFHGGLTSAERVALAARGIDPIDLSASLNPYAPYPAVVEAARSAAFDRYPEPDAASLCEAYASTNGLDAGHVLAGNGSSELIYLALRALAASGDCIVIAGPTFGEYAAAAEAAGARTEVVLAGAPGFELDIAALEQLIALRRPAVMVVCNPNNPTGRLLPAEAIDRLTRAVRAAGGHLLVDEAYADFAPPSHRRAEPGPGRAVLRSLTKLHAIPGLRLGFLLAEPEVVRAVARLQPPWPVNAAAMAAALAALDNSGCAARDVERVARAREALRARLVAAGFRVVPSTANFLLVEVGDAPVFRSRLLERGFAVRDCSSFGLPQHIRVAIPREDGVDHLARAMEASR